ncbi:hypothetical protein ACWH9L_000551 [Salmonella enterica subsp. enterica serovar Typhi]|uniref:hypothetical protein n=1 Tax=Enterobacteriaceae TaxID=543 RepID=UPI00067DC80A|nr:MULTISPECIES: hypothetical protein [Enterobacteriaceae]EBI8961535.1 hypothetical protein [Salmonella enterica]EBI9664450.1 hypothetical protein [Salmonella enterica]EBL7956546.1 hypothetical protein [Salmonella enterica]MDM9533456.1 hypothetical protein [Salmonella enterica subsp. enterica serovar Typhi]MDM9550033.1 hypothetical protein [Salmonella enterica subsp. enterica serovar Typhi]
MNWKQQKKRIAELEARKVTLSAEKFCPAEYAGSLLWAETEVWNKAISACAVVIRAAGIRIKGEMTPAPVLRINRKCLASTLHPAGCCNKHF